MFLRRIGSYYHVVWTENQTRKKRSVSTHTTHLETAERFLRNFRPPKRTITLQRLFDLYGDYSKTSLSLTTYKRTAYSARNLFRFMDPKTEIGRIIATDLEQYKSRRLSEKVTPVTVNIELRHIKTVFSKAVEWGFIERHPFKGVKQLRTPQRAPLYFSIADIDALVAAARYPWLKRVILFAFATGMRRNEIINLKWEHVNLRLNYVRVANTAEFTTKNRRERLIPLNTTAMQVLKELTPTTAYLFMSHYGTKLDPRRVSEAVKSTVKKAGLDPRFHMHHLRHSFCTLLLQAGATLQEVQRLAGHSTPAVTDRYNQMVSLDQKEAVMRLDELHGKAVNSREKD